MRAKLRWTVLVGLVFLMALGMVWIVRAKRAVEEARLDVSESAIPFQIRPISDSNPATVDFLPSPPDFRDGQLFHDLLYICGAGGLWAYDLTGNLHATYLVGRDLPPSPPVTMAVGTVAGDAEPKLWIASSTVGILVFDGVRFSQIQVQADKGYGTVTSLLILPTGILLMGFSEGGVIAYDGAAMAPFHASLRNIPVTALAGSEGDLWIGTRDRGVIHWQGGTAEEFHDQNGLPDNRVLSIAASEDRVFVGTSVGAAEFRNGKFVRHVANGVFSQTLLATKDRLLIGTVDEGIVEVKLTNERAARFIPVSDGEPHTARRLLELGGIPFALTADGLFEQEVRTGLWTRRIATANSNWTNRNISALSVDSTGKLWIGYFDHGMDIAETDDVQKAVHIEDDQVFCVNRIVPDPHRNMQVVATANGLVLFSPQGKILRRIARADGLISDHVADVAVRPEGLAAATAAGVTLMDSGGPESIYAFHGLAWQTIMCIRSALTGRACWRERSEDYRSFKMGLFVRAIRPAIRRSSRTGFPLLYLLITRGSSAPTAGASFNSMPADNGRSFRTFLGKPSSIPTPCWLLPAASWPEPWIAGSSSMTLPETDGHPQPTGFLP